MRTRDDRHVFDNQQTFFLAVAFRNVNRSRAAFAANIADSFSEFIMHIKKVAEFETSKNICCYDCLIIKFKSK